MKMTRLTALCLASLWIAACATAQDGTPSSMTDVPGGGSSNDSPSGAGTYAASGAPSNAFGGSAGVDGVGGSTGQSGASGLGGANAGGGSDGSGGNGGSGGNAPTFEAGVCADNATITLSYLHSNTKVQQITGQYQFINTSATPIPMSDLKIRYFLTNEETSGWTLTVYDSHIDGGTGYRSLTTQTAFALVPLAQPLEGADTYTEVTFPGASATLEMGATALVSWDVQPHDYNPPDQIQSNDYSYDAAATAPTVWNHVAVYQGNTLVGGCVPHALGNGLGEGGETANPGAAGDTGAAGVAGAL